MVVLSQQSRTRLLPQRQLAVLLLLLSLLAAHTVAARVLQQREDIDIRQHSKRRSLQQSSNRPGPGVMFAGTTVQPATPLARLNEELPQGVLMTSSDVDTVTISLILKDTKAEDFRASYQATIAAVTAKISGTPALQWNFKASNSDGAVAAVSSSNTTSSTKSTNSTGTAANQTSSNSTTAVRNATVKVNTTMQVNATAQVLLTNSSGNSSTSQANSSDTAGASTDSSSSSSSGSSQTSTSDSGSGSAQQSGGSSSSSAGNGDTASTGNDGSSSSSGGGGRRRLQPEAGAAEMYSVSSITMRTLQQQGGAADLTVTLSIFTANPKLVIYRLTQAASVAAAAAAAALRNSCSTEYCARLVAAGVPVDSASIVVKPDFSAFLGKAANAQQDTERRQFLGAVIGGTIGGAVLLATIAVIAWKVSRRNIRSAASQDLPAVERRPDAPTAIIAPTFEEPKAKLLQDQAPKTAARHQDKAVLERLRAAAAALKPVSRQQSAGDKMPVAAPAPVLVAAPPADSDEGQPEADYFPASDYELYTFHTQKNSSSRRNSFGRRSFGDRPLGTGESIRSGHGPRSSNIRSQDGSGARAVSTSAATASTKPASSSATASAYYTPSASGLTSPSPFPVVLSSYGTPTAKATPELVPQINKMAVDPSQLEEALSQYYASVIEMSQLLDPAAARLTPGASPLQTPVHRSPRQSETGGQRVSSALDAEMQSAGWIPQLPKLQV